MATSTQNGPSWEKMMNFDHLSKGTTEHLKRVYGTLSVALLAAAAGGYVHMFTNFMQAGFLSLFASLGLLVLLMATPHEPQNQGKRVGCLTGFAFFTGVGLGPALDMAALIDPSIIPTAFMGTAVVFICFSMCALLSQDRKWLYLGGTLFSGLSMMMILGLANIFFGSRLLFEVNLYIGLAVMCGFVLYDTQLIIEKHRRGDNDYIWHCVDLFIDLVGIFRRLLVLLSNKEEKKRRN